MEDIPNLVEEYGVEILTLAIPSLKSEKLQEILDIVTPLGLTLNSMPALEEFAKGNMTLSRLKNIDVVDLLGRKEVTLDVKKVKDQITDKVILVTRAGGSIGSEICRQLIKFNPKQLLLLGHGENSIYLIHQELSQKYTDKITEIYPIIADIQDKERLSEVMWDFHPYTIYHTAAHKHVPLMEYNPKKAVKNNIYGTKNLAETAIKYQVKNFVLI